MSDPRVASLLPRLGGLYRDPSRVDRDASAVLGSSVGQHLQPKILNLVENDGTSSPTLCLQGTIAMHFKGKTYQLLVDIYLPPGYPSRPPVCFVRLAPNMYYKERHAHVGSDGCVYLPYLHEWRNNTHNLIELVVAMSSVFSADPPVFTRSSTTAAAATSSLSSDVAAQVQRAVAQEVEEANAVAEAARRAEEEERMEQQQYQDIKARVNGKLQSHLQNVSLETQQSLRGDVQDQRRLQQSVATQQLEYLTTLQTQLHDNIETVEEATEEIKKLLERARQEQQEKDDEDDSASNNKNKKSIEDICIAASPLHQQMLELAAEIHAISDALYFFDRALQRGSVDVQTHLKHVRQLSKKQFLTYALLHKIQKRSVEMKE